MATTVGTAVIELSFDGKNVKSSVKSAGAEAQKEAEGIGTKIGGVAKNIGKALAAAFTTATAAAVAFSKKSIDAFNKSEEALAKLSQAAKNQNWAEGAVDDLQAYNAEIQKLGIIGDEIFTAGQAQLGTFALSADAVKKLTPAMGDLLAATSGYGTTTENATQMANLMGKVMTGNVGALTRYGITLDDNQKKLLAEGDEMTRAATLAEVLSKNYGGVNQVLSQTPQGQVKQLANNFGDLQESFGAFIAGKSDLNTFFDALRSFIDDVVAMIPTFVPQIVEGVTSLISEIGVQLPEIINQIMPVLVQALIDLTMALAQALPSFIQALLNVILAIANALIANIGTILSAINTVIIEIVKVLTAPDNLSAVLQAALTLFMAIMEAFPDLMVALIDALPQILENIVEFLLDPDNLSMIIESAVHLFMGVVQAVPRILGALLSAFGSLVGNLWDWITSRFGQFASDFGNFVGNIFKGAINGMITFIENFINTPIDLLNGFIDIINGAFGWIGVNLGKIDRIQLPRLAQGGIVNSTTIAMIGEQGQEAVIPLEHNTDNWAGLLASTLAIEMEEQDIGSNRPINVYMTNQIDNVLDADEIGQVMMESIRRAA